MRRYFVLLGVLVVLMGCTTRPKQINPFPAVQDQANAGHVTVIRNQQPIGSGVNFVFTIDGIQIYKFRPGDRIDFLINPDEYIFGVEVAMAEGKLDQWREIQVEIKPELEHIYRLFFDLRDRGLLIQRSTH